MTEMEASGVEEVGSGWDSLADCKANPVILLTHNPRI